MSKIEYVKREISFQVVTDTGETVGLPFKKFEDADEWLEDILESKETIQELCPDTDIKTIKYLTIDPIVNELSTSDVQHTAWTSTSNLN